MIDDKETRAEISGALGKAVDDLVRDHMKGLVEEPDISSRIGQRLEDRFDGRELGGYRVRVITETITSHGANSLEKPLGTDLYFAISVQNKNGVEIKKGILVQAKRRDRVKWKDLEEHCRRMKLLTKKGSVVWIYNSNCVDVLRSTDVPIRKDQPFSVDKFFNRVLECELGDRHKVPSGSFGDRGNLKAMLQDLGAQNAIWLELERS